MNLTVANMQWYYSSSLELHIMSSSTHWLYQGEAKLPYLPAPTEEEVLAQHGGYCRNDCAFQALHAVQASPEQIELSSEGAQCFSLVFSLHGPNFCQIACDLGVQVPL